MTSPTVTDRLPLDPIHSAADLWLILGTVSPSSDDGDDMERFDLRLFTLTLIGTE